MSIAATASGSKNFAHRHRIQSAIMSFWGCIKIIAAIMVAGLADFIGNCQVTAAAKKQKANKRTRMKGSKPKKESTLHCIKLQAMMELEASFVNSYCTSYDLI